MRSFNYCSCTFLPSPRPHHSLLYSSSAIPDWKTVNSLVPAGFSATQSHSQRGYMSFTPLFIKKCGRIYLSNCVHFSCIFVFYCILLFNRVNVVLRSSLLRGLQQVLQVFKLKIGHKKKLDLMRSSSHTMGILCKHCSIRKEAIKTEQMYS